MKKIVLASAIAGLMIGTAHAANKAEVIVDSNQQFLEHMVPMNNSGITGTITVIPVAVDKTKLVAVIKGKNVSGPMPFSINLGRCDNPAAKVKYPLTEVVHGKSETVISAATSSLFQGDQLSINLGESKSTPSKSVACGNIQ